MAREEITRPAPAQVERAARFGTATLHEAAGQCGALPSAIRPVGPDFRICGAAVTVLSPPRDNLWLHREIDHPIRIGDGAVFPGDLVTGESDGVAVVRRADAAAVLAAGASTLELYGFD